MSDISEYYNNISTAYICIFFIILISIYVKYINKSIIKFIIQKK